MSEKVFYPRPKVQSAVVRLIRKSNFKLACPEDLFFRVVKAGFGQRRKTLRNSLKVVLEKKQIQNPILQKRAEQLSVEDFVELTNLISDSSIL